MRRRLTQKRNKSNLVNSRRRSRLRPNSRRLRRSRKPSRNRRSCRQMYNTRRRVIKKRRVTKRGGYRFRDLFSRKNSSSSQEEEFQVKAHKVDPDVEKKIRKNDGLIFNIIRANHFYPCKHVKLNTVEFNTMPSCFYQWFLLTYIKSQISDKLFNTIRKEIFGYKTNNPCRDSLRKKSWWTNRWINNLKELSDEEASQSLLQELQYCPTEGNIMGCSFQVNLVSFLKRIKIVMYLIYEKVEIDFKVPDAPDDELKKFSELEAKFKTDFVDKYTNIKFTHFSPEETKEFWLPTLNKRSKDYFLEPNIYLRNKVVKPFFVENENLAKIFTIMFKTFLHDIRNWTDLPEETFTKRPWSSATSNSLGIYVSMYEAIANTFGETHDLTTTYVNKSKIMKLVCMNFLNADESELFDYIKKNKLSSYVIREFLIDAICICIFNGKTATKYDAQECIKTVNKTLHENEKKMYYNSTMYDKNTNEDVTFNTSTLGNVLRKIFPSTQNLFPNKFESSTIRRNLKKVGVDKGQVDYFLNLLQYFPQIEQSNPLLGNKGTIYVKKNKQYNINTAIAVATSANQLEQIGEFDEYYQFPPNDWVPYDIPLKMYLNIGPTIDRNKPVIFVAKNENISTDYFTDTNHIELPKDDKSLTNADRALQELQFVVATLIANMPPPQANDFYANINLINKEKGNWSVYIFGNSYFTKNLFKKMMPRIHYEPVHELITEHYLQNLQFDSPYEELGVVHEPIAAQTIAAPIIAAPQKVSSGSSKYGEASNSSSGYDEPRNSSQTYAELNSPPQTNSGVPSQEPKEHENAEPNPTTGKIVYVSHGQPVEVQPNPEIPFYSQPVKKVSQKKVSTESNKYSEPNDGSLEQPEINVALPTQESFYGDVGPPQPAESLYGDGDPQQPAVGQYGEPNALPEESLYGNINQNNEIKILFPTPEDKDKLNAAKESYLKKSCPFTFVDYKNIDDTLNAWCIKHKIQHPERVLALLRHRCDFFKGGFPVLSSADYETLLEIMNKRTHNKLTEEILNDILYINLTINTSDPSKTSKKLQDNQLAKRFVADMLDVKQVSPRYVEGYLFDVKQKEGDQFSFETELPYLILIYLILHPVKNAKMLKLINTITALTQKTCYDFNLYNFLSSKKIKKFTESISSYILEDLYNPSRNEKNKYNLTDMSIKLLEAIFITECGTIRSSKGGATKRQKPKHKKNNKKRNTRR